MTQQGECRKVILAVDDDPAVLRVVAGVLGRDYEVRVVASGSEAMEDLEALATDLVLLDVSMPGVDGFEVLQAALRTNPNIRVVMLTGVSDLDVVLRAMALGAQGYVTKPFSAGELQNAVDHVLRPSAGGQPGDCPWRFAPDVPS